MKKFAKTIMAPNWMDSCDLVANAMAQKFYGKTMTPNCIDFCDMVNTQFLSMWLEGH